LGDDDKRKKDKGTARLDSGKADVFATQRVSPFFDADADEEEIDLPWVVELRLDGAKTLHQRISDTVTIGRGSGAGAPDIDLTPYFAAENGVSRRHAIILVRRRFLTVRDLNSTNGTCINGLRLMPQQDVPLEHGDHLRFGRLRAMVAFALVPPNSMSRAGDGPSPQRHAYEPGRGRRVLVHEQGDAAAEVYQMMLSGAGYQVQTSRDVTETAARVSELRPAAVVVDMTTDFPEASALDLVRLLRNRAPGTPILVTVPADRPRTYERARETGAKAVMVKPLHTEQFLKTMGQLTNPHRGHSAGV